MADVLLSASVMLVPATREWTSACYFDPQRLGALLRVPLAHDWPRDFFNLGAPYVLEEWNDGEEGWWYWWVVERATGPNASDAFVGCAGFKGPPTAGGNVELQYALAPSVRRRGLMSECVRMLSGWAFRTPKVQRVIATIDPANVASCGVVRRCGFSECEAESDDALKVYALDRHPGRRAITARRRGPQLPAAE